MSVPRIATLVGALAAAAAFLAVAPAPAAAHPSNAASPDSVTGCLKKGDKPNTFSVTTKAGKTVWVTSQAIPLAGHVGHTVTLTGDMASSMGGMSDTSKMSGMSDTSKMGGSMGSTLNVTKMKMVSATCS